MFSHKFWQAKNGLRFWTSVTCWCCSSIISMDCSSG